MKYSFLLLILSLFFYQCKTTKTLERNHVEVVEAYIAAIENKDFDTMDSLTTDQFYSVGPSLGDTIQKDEMLRNWRVNSKTTIEQINFRESRVSLLAMPSRSEYGDWVGEWSIAKIKYKNGNDPVKLFINSNYLVVGGKISRALILYNQADMYNQLGYRFSKPDSVVAQ
ncbi:MAG: nuclear transport factor 2 family protein [Reichenbachiella sp.]